MSDGMRIVREFDAPPERVWAEWTTPDAFADWFGGPESEVIDVVMDVRPGGTWSATMFAGPGRREIRWAGEYLTVRPPDELRLTLTDQPGIEAREIVTVTFADLGEGRTEMRFAQTGQMTEAQYRAATSGWGTFFDRMSARIVS